MANRSARLRTGVLFAAMVTTAGIGPARADPSPAVPGRGRWYGWQTLAADGIAASFAVGALAIDDANYRALFARTAYATYLVVPPVIHIAHDRNAAAGASFVLRLLSPLILGLVGWNVGNRLHARRCAGSRDPFECGGPTEPGYGSLAGIAGGFLLGVAADALWLGHATPRPPTPATTPTVSFDQDRVVVGAGGTF